MLHWKPQQSLYLNDQTERIPVIRMLFTEASELKRRAEAWCERLKREFPDADFQVEPTTCYVGGGVAPMKGLPSFAVSATISWHKTSRTRQEDFDSQTCSGSEDRCGPIVF